MAVLKNKGYTIYSVLTSLLWEAILAVVVLRLLPKYGVNIPLWALIVLMALFGAYEYMSYRLGKRALDRMPLVSLEVLIGTKCKTITPLNPRGYVRIGGELWRAKAESDIAADEEVTVIGVERMTFLVRPPDNNRNKKSNPELSSGQGSA